VTFTRTKQTLFGWFTKSRTKIYLCSTNFSLHNLLSRCRVLGRTKYPIQGNSERSHVLCNL